MITLSDGMEVAMPSGIPFTAPVSAGGVPADTRARVATTERDGNLLARIRVVLAVVWADLAGAWVWRGQPPTLRDLWRDRIPAVDRVPGGSRALWIGWVGWNHAALLIFAPLASVLWIAQHPARAGLAALIAAPLIAMWIS